MYLLRCVTELPSQLHGSAVSDGTRTDNLARIQRRLATALHTHLGATMDCVRYDISCTPPQKVRTGEKSKHKYCHTIAPWRTALPSYYLPHSAPDTPLQPRGRPSRLFQYMLARGRWAQDSTCYSVKSIQAPYSMKCRCIRLSVVGVWIILLLLLCRNITK